MTWWKERNVGVNGEGSLGISLHPLGNWKEYTTIHFRVVFQRRKNNGKMWTQNQQKIMHIVEGKDKGKKCFSVLWNHDLELPICATGVQNVPL